MKIKTYCQIIPLLVLASLLSITAFAQDESEAKSPLELKLTAQTTAFCIGSPLALELEVTNNGQKDIALSNTYLWRDFSYAYLAQKGRDRSGASSTRVDNVGRSFVLHPGESYRSTYELQLPSNFFQEAGTYTLMTYLDDIYSNEVTFELYNCGNPQEVKEQ